MDKGKKVQIDKIAELLISMLNSLKRNDKFFFGDIYYIKLLVFLINYQDLKASSDTTNLCQFLVDKIWEAAFDETPTQRTPIIFKLYTARLLLYLRDKEVLEIPEDFFLSLDVFFSVVQEKLLVEENLSSVSGAIGVANYFISRKQYHKLSPLLELLDLKKQTTDDSCFWIFYSKRHNAFHIDLSMESGLPGVLKFLAEMSAQKIEDAKVNSLMQKSIIFFKNYVLEQPNLWNNSKYSEMFRFSKEIHTGIHPMVTYNYVVSLLDNLSLDMITIGLEDVKCLESQIHTKKQDNYSVQEYFYLTQIASRKKIRRQFNFNFDSKNSLYLSLMQLENKSFHPVSESLLDWGNFIIFNHLINKEIEPTVNLDNNFWVFNVKTPN